MHTVLIYLLVNCLLACLLAVLNYFNLALLHCQKNQCEDSFNK